LKHNLKPVPDDKVVLKRMPPNSQLVLDMPSDLVKKLVADLEEEEWLRQQREQAEGNAVTKKGVICVNPMTPRQFQWFVNSSILYKCFTIGLLADSEVGSVGAEMLDALGQIWFFAEVGFRTGLLAKDFVSIYCSSRWMMMDFVLICFGVLPWVLVPFGGPLAEAGSLLRALQLVRFGHFKGQAEKLRYHNMFRQFYMVMEGCYASVFVMMYNIAVMMFSCFAFACFSVFLFGRYVRDGHELEEYFGWVGGTMVTFFQITVLDGGLELARRAIRHQNGTAILFVLLILWQTMILLNVVTSTMFEPYFDLCSEDQERNKKMRMQSTLNMARELTEIFVAGDDEGDGLVSKQEFEKMFLDPKAKELIAQFAIERKDVEDVFAYLDEDNSGSLEPEDFLRGICKMQGPAMARDLYAMQKKLERFGRDMKELLEMVEKKLRDAAAGNIPSDHSFEPYEDDEGSPTVQKIVPSDPHNHHPPAGVPVGFSEDYARRLIWLMKFLINAPGQSTRDGTSATATPGHQHFLELKDDGPAEQKEYKLTATALGLRPSITDAVAAQPTTLEKKIKYPNLYYMVQTASYESCVCGLICFNCLTIGAQANLAEGQNSTIFQLLDAICLIAFISEALIQSLANGFVEHYLLNMWHLADLLLIFVCGVLASWVLEPLGYEWGATLRAMQMLRAMRMVKPVARSKHRPEFRQVWMIIGGVAHATKIMCYNALVLIFVLFGFGAMAAETLGKGTKDLDDEEGQYIHDRFSGMGPAMFTMLQIMLLDGGLEIARVAIRRFPLSFFLLFVYMGVGILTVVNVIFATVVECVLDLGRAYQAKFERKREAIMHARLNNLERMFKVLDRDGGGTLSKKEFIKVFENPNAAAQLRALSVGPSDVEEVFGILDDDFSGTLDLGEFIEGIAKIQGQAKAKDLMIAERTLTRIFSMLAQRLDVLQRLVVDLTPKIADKVFTRITEELRGAFGHEQRRFLCSFLDQLEKSQDVTSADPVVMRITDIERYSSQQVLSTVDSPMIFRRDSDPVATENRRLQQEVGRIRRQLVETNHELASMKTQLAMGEASVAGNRR